jgi:uncharacterized membrane protein
MRAKAFFKVVSKKVIDYFLQGLLLVAPFGLTFYFIYICFIKINDLAQDHIDKVLPFRIPGLGFLLLFILITTVGYFGHKLLSQPIKLLIEKLIAKVPFIQVVYSSIRDFLSAFVGKEKKFTQPVLVKINKISDLEKIGFLTSTDLNELGIKDSVAVYFPHSYAFSGELFIVPSNQVKPLDIPPAEAMKFVVSGGISKLEMKQ